MSLASRLPLTLRLCLPTAVLALSCAEPTVSKSADPTRALAPIPVCVKHLPRRASSDFARQIPEADYFGLVIPAFENDFARPTSSTAACNGDRVFEANAFADAEFVSSAKERGSLTYGGGANRLRILWLRTHRKGAHEVGPLALVRIQEDHAEVYGVGSYEGDPEKSRFGIERIGGELVVTATSDDCAGTNATKDCDSRLSIFFPTAGRLVPLAEVWLERVRFASGLEPGTQGLSRFRLSSSPSFQKDGVHVVEEIQVTDSAGRKLRRAELERLYRLDGSGLKPAAESLWVRMYESRVSGNKNTEGALPEQAPATP